MVKISVITAVFNAKDTIEGTIDSILSQTYGNVELIVIDGGSTDGTVEIIEKYRNNLAVFVSEGDRGIYDALNKGIGYATGEVVGFLHAADIFASTTVLSAVAAGFSRSSIDCVYGDLVYTSKGNFDNVVRYWISGTYDEGQLKFGWMPPHPTFYCRRSIYQKMGYFDTTFSISADYDCMVRFIRSEKFECHYIQKILIKMQLGGKSNKSIANIFRKSVEDYKVIKKNKIGGVGVLVFKNLRKIPQFIRFKFALNKVT